MKKTLALFLGTVFAFSLALPACGETADGKYDVILKNNIGGTVSVDKQKADAGEIVNITATPDAGYYLETLSLDGESCYYAFEMPEADVELTALFAQAELGVTYYPVTVDTSVGGQMTVNTSVMTDKLNAAEGETVTLSVTPEEGYTLDYLELNGEELEETSFTMPKGEAILYACFVSEKAVSYSVTAENGNHGTVKVNKTECVEGGAIVADYIPLNGYILDYFTVNGQNVGSNPVLTMPAENAVVSAVFKKAIEDTTVSISSKTSNGTANSYWYFNKSQDNRSVTITVKVEDPLLIMTGEEQYRDYVEVIVHIAGNTAWQKSSTVKVTVTADGSAYMRKAVSTTAFGVEQDVPDNYVSYESKIKRLLDKDGYSGYEVTMTIDCALVGAASASDLVFAPAMNNSESLYSNNWECFAGCTWLNAGTFLTIS